jgi:RloB-like protein
MSKRKSRPQVTSIFIACEGKNTEPIYFERIKEEVEECNLLEITIYPDKNEEEPKTDALGLIREARNRIDDFDEVWAVFDKNGYTKHKEAFDEANKTINGKKVRIAFSSISFEHWILLHFEKNDSCFLKSANIIETKFTSNETYFSNYSKRANFDIYPKLKNHTENAVKNAAWLKFQQKENLKNNEIYEVNPYTDVDVLVKRLFGIETTIGWTNFGETIDFDKCEVKVDLQGNELSLKITSKKEATLFSTELKCFVIDSNSNTIECEIEKLSLNPNDEKVITVRKDFSEFSFVKLEFENSVYFLEIL